MDFERCCILHVKYAQLACETVQTIMESDAICACEKNVSTDTVLESYFIIIIIIIIIQHLYSAIVSYAGCRGACGAS